MTELSVRGSEKAAMDAVAAVHDAVMVEGPIGKRDEALYSGFQFLYSTVNVYFKIYRELIIGVTPLRHLVFSALL